MSNGKELQLVENVAGTALAQYGNRDVVRELFERLLQCHPARAEVGPETLLAVSQLAIISGANPLPGTNGIHVWKDKGGRTCFSFGIDYWRGKAEDVGGIYWLRRPQPMSPHESQLNGVGQGQIGAIAEAALWTDIRRVRQEAARFGETMTLAEAARQVSLVGTAVVGNGDFAANGRTLMWKAQKRAEMDLYRQLLPSTRQMESLSVEEMTKPRGLTSSWADEFFRPEVVIEGELAEMDANDVLFGDSATTPTRHVHPPAPPAPPTPPADEFAPQEEGEAEPEGETPYGFQPISELIHPAEPPVLTFDRYVFNNYARFTEDGLWLGTALELRRTLEAKFGEVFVPAQILEYEAYIVEIGDVLAQKWVEFNSSGRELYGELTWTKEKQAELMAWAKHSGKEGWRKEVGAVEKRELTYSQLSRAVEKMQEAIAKQKEAQLSMALDGQNA